MTDRLRCDECAGTGWIPCGDCGGTGDFHRLDGVERPCPFCRGAGSTTCRPCVGSGFRRRPADRAALPVRDRYDRED